MVFNDPKWDWRTFDLDRDMATADEACGGLLTGVNPMSIVPSSTGRQAPDLSRLG